MSEDFDFDPFPKRTPLDDLSHYLKTISPAPRAVLFFVLPFIFADFWNYYSAGVALILSAPILGLLYVGCGMLAARFASDQGNTRFAFNGAISGGILWLASTLVNGFISLLFGTVSLGTTLLLGVPYLCLCAPFNLVIGGLVGALGGLVYSWFYHHRPKREY